MVAIAIYLHTSTKNKFKRELHTDQTIRVTIDAKGMRSATGELAIVTPWTNVRGSKLEADRIIIFIELIAHYIPKRALPNGAKLESLYDQIERKVAEGAIINNA